METHVLASEVDLLPVVDRVLKTAANTSSKQAAVIALYGDLGAGKTTFVQTLAQSLGVQGSVTSPTFVLQKTYSTESATWPILVHLDAYRLDSPDELATLGFAELLTQTDRLVCIEWADRVATWLPEHTLHLTLSVDAHGVHSITHNLS